MQSSIIHDSTPVGLYMIMFLKNFDTVNNLKYGVVAIKSNMSGRAMIKDPQHTEFRNISIQNGVTSLNYSANVIMSENVVENTKCLVLEIPMAVSVHKLDYEYGSTDGSYVFPASKCSTRYIVPSYLPFLRSVIGMGSLNNNTDITILFNIDNQGKVVINGIPYRSGESVKITLQQYETFQLTSDYDLTGTEIISSNPVCVFAGNICPVLNIGCSHMSEMIPPTSAFSDSYIIPTLFDQPHSLIRVISEENGTAVSLNSQTITLQSKQFNDSTINHNVANTITSNKPILVMLYAFGYIADPFMMTIPAVSQYLHDYQFYVPDSGFTSYVSVVIESSEMFGLRLDNNNISPLSSSSVSVGMNIKHYVTFAVNITPGGHHMRHIGGVKFGLFVYGRQQNDGYGYPAGYDF